MSGQPYRNQLDMSVARDSYLANLKLRAELDDKNFQANKVYIKTGQLPQEPTDQRTLTEKLADVERMKIDIRSKLLAITDGTEAGKIVEQLTPDQLVFLTQQFEPIKDQMKKNYAVGVLAPIFIDYLTKFIDKFNMTRGVELGLQQTSANQLLANQRLILSQMASKRDIQEITDTIDRLGIQNSNMGKSINAGLRDINEILDYLPETFAELSKAENSIQKSQILELLNGIISELPTRTDLLRSLGEIERGIQMRDKSSISATIERLDELLTTGGDIREEMAILKGFVAEVKAGRPIDIGQLQEAQAVAVAKAGGEDIKQGKVIKGGEFNLMSSNSPDFNRGEAPTQKGKSRESMTAYFGAVYPNVRANYPTEAPTQASLLSSILGRKITSSFSKLNYDEQKMVIRAMNEMLIGNGYNPPMGGAGMSGCGIARRIRPSQVLSTDIDYSMGITESPKFIPIGRYLINKRQLDKDIVAIKRKGGSIINTLPSQRVSRKLGNVIKKIVGGHIPSYDDFNELSNEDKVFLDKVAKETRIDDKLSIPAPKKNDEEKDINQFEILKGQILAGNDNPDVVRKFKTLILKLSNNNLIPKGQVRELLLELTTLGH
jgi:hypothetical protein